MVKQTSSPPEILRTCSTRTQLSGIEFTILTAF
jgi:hypothetical protein